jgi:hypothetical protein
MNDHQGLKVGQTVLFQVKKTLMWGVIVALLDRGLIKVWTSRTKGALKTLGTDMENANLNLEVSPARSL